MMLATVVPCQLSYLLYDKLFLALNFKRSCINREYISHDWSSTMCDFHNFGLIFTRPMHCLPQGLKSTLFEIFSKGGCPKGTRSVEKNLNNIDFSL